MGYELAADSIILQSRPHSFQRILTTDVPVTQQSGDSDPRWALISSLGLWFTWRARCRRIFESRPIPPAETLKDF